MLYKIVVLIGFMLSSLSAMQHCSTLSNDYVDFIEKQWRHEQTLNVDLQNKLTETLSVILLFQQRREEDKKLIKQQAALIKFLQDKERRRRGQGIASPRGIYLKDKTA